VPVLRLGRGLGIYDAPRFVIEAMPGMQLAEMDRHGRDAYCCGAGSFVRYDFPEFTDKTGAERFGEVEATGAQIVLTACLECVTQLQYIRAQLESRVQVMDLVSLVNRVGRWRYSPVPARNVLCPSNLRQPKLCASAYH